MSFQIPLNFEDLTRPNNTQWQVTPSQLRRSSVESLLSLFDEDVTPIFSESSHEHHFNALYALITRYKSLKTSEKGHVLNIIEKVSQAITLTDSTSIKVALYFASGLAVTASSVTPSCKFWDKTGRVLLLQTIYQLLSSIPIPSSSNESAKDQIASLLVRTMLQVLEYPSAAKDKSTRAILSQVLSWVLSFDQRQVLPANTALLHALNRHEHIATPLAIILHRLAELNASQASFVSEFIREIARLPSEHLARDSSAAKSIATFISELSERLPDMCRANLALLLSHLDGESYIVRNGLVHMIGKLIIGKPDPEDPLLQVLLDRAHRDIHAFTRSKAMQTWISIVNAKVVPISLYPSLAEMGTSRLEDKAVAVRKYASQLLTALLKNNPFGPSLRRSHFEAKWNEIAPNNDIEHAEEDQPPNENESEAGDGNESEPETTVEVELEQGDDDSTSELVEEKPLHEKIYRIDEEAENANDDDGSAVSIDEELGSQHEEQTNPEEEDPEIVLKRKYYMSSLLFIKTVEKGLQTLYDMLRSKSVTDVAEAVSFLIIAVQFQLEAVSGIAVRIMLPLILAREANIRQIAVKAYANLLCPGGLELADEKDAALAIAKSLVALGIGATTGELACIESLISALFREGEGNIISAAVIAVLWDLFEGRIPGANVAQRRTACILVGMIAAERPQTLQQKIHVLESVGICDPELARWSCTAVCKLQEGVDKDGHLSTQLSEVIKTSNSMSTIEQAVNAIFRVSPEPEKIVGALLRDLAKSLHSKPTAINAIDLSRFLVFVGHVAVKELVRIEVLISKVRKGIAEQAKSGGNHDDEEQANAEADRALELAEKELVNPSSLLGRYGLLARKLASDNSAKAILQASAVLCLAKLMCVQEKFCEANLRLLFSILASATEPLVRSNAVTALGDLAFRFPNLVEPWSSHIYSSLRDSDEKVRKNTLMTLTHLILNDMIKVKGQIVGLAICILDDDERIAELARLFFNELARKASNAIYNILPDTISCMSKMDDLSKSGFKTVVSFLVGLMDKEKHGDGMVEKLCHRFRTSESDRETQELAYCISILNISERGLKKLSENFKSYSTKLGNDDVYEHISTAVSKCNKQGISSTWIQTIEELQQKIERARAPENDSEGRRQSLQSTSSKPADSSKTCNKPSRKPRAQRKKIIISCSDSESEAASDVHTEDSDTDGSDSDGVEDLHDEQEYHPRGSSSRHRSSRRRSSIANQ
ncbi:Condensin complex subunit 1 [Gracilariopsis chorda]|uniref:Condensin complex subunit 1 n=1 Tax=Gracilariopsis chorda TaxID=448386 RepID=A0A2V3IHV6_9FLOR|nr:Condensin complex subunit 1 [Gracilariopsis chorda]|eukprot:PXF41618.1 Condensin complex subunit 1 [Gracilariopsis chorda]